MAALLSAGSAVHAQPSAPAPSLADVAQAYRQHVRESNAEIIGMMGDNKAQMYLVRLVDVEPVFCEFHSGTSHLCRVVVVVQVNGRTSPRRAGDVLMTPDEAGGWRFRLLRRPR